MTPLVAGSALLGAAQGLGTAAGPAPARPVSPSQIRLWRACQRAWHYRYVLGRTAPQTAAQARGLAVEAAVVGYARGEGVAVETAAGRIALAGLSWFAGAWGIH